MNDFAKKADQLLYEMGWMTGVIRCALEARKTGNTDLYITLMELLDNPPKPSEAK